jgi:D-arabinose 1-dehydrogenase-like Zn-dependent alcohol dehydrogenase
VSSPGPGEILIRVAACGVCHTDLDVLEAGRDMEGGYAEHLLADEDFASPIPAAQCDEEANRALCDLEERRIRGAKVLLP